MFSYVNTVAAAAAYVSTSQNVRSARVVSGMMDSMWEDTIRSDVTQTAIRLGCAAAKNTCKPEQSPEFKNPALIIKAGRWSLNRVADGYVAHACIGSCKHPSRVALDTPKWLGDKLSDYGLGGLWITPGACTIMHSGTVKSVCGLDPPRNMASVPELSSGVPYLHGACGPLTAADMNGYGAMACTSCTVAKFDFIE